VRRARSHPPKLALRSKCLLAHNPGFRVEYQPGWDCHGLPIEIKAVGSNVQGLDALEIRRRARKLARATVAQQEKSFRSFGVMADWERRWLTMDFEYEMRQLELFRQLAQRGLVYRRRKPVYWSPSSGTALAEAELEYNEQHVSRAAYVRYKLADGRSLGFDGPLYALVWTTTPWTLPANRAIAVHDDLEYCIVKKGGDGLIVAKSRLEALESVLGQVEIISSIPGSVLGGLFYTNKLQNASQQPLIHAEFVSADSGTGLVHCAPGHGQDDYEVCARLGIAAVAPINDAGHFTTEAYPADPEKLTSAPSILDGGGNVVLQLLGEDVVHTHDYCHKYPYDWRTKRPVVLRATEQWFADVGAIKEDAVAALKDVDFIPPAGRERLTKFVQGRSEWCISRQRAWGVPIPAIYDETGEAVMTDDSISHIITTFRERGTDSWFSDPADDPAWILPSLMTNGKKYRRGTDTMDVWFDSGSSWTQAPTPADVYLEGSDQHRGWFQSSLLTHVAANRDAAAAAPFKTIVTHGFTLDQEGKKMSKSRGNTIEPDAIMDGSLLPPVSVKGKKPAPGAPPTYDALGPDALRLWAAGAEYTRDVVIGEAVLKTVHTTLVKYRVLLRMLLGSLALPPPTPNPIAKLDRIALAQLDHAMADVGRSFGRFEFYKAYGSLNRWAVSDLSAFYLEALKDRLYCGDGGGQLGPLLVGFLRMLAPMAPLLVEEAWAHRPQWMKDDPSFTHPATHIYNSPVFENSAAVFAERSAEDIRQDYAVLSGVHEATKAALERARADKVLGSSLQAAIVITTTSSSNLRDVLDRYADELDSIFVVSGVDVGQRPSNAIAHQEFDSGTISVVPPRLHKCGRCWRYLAPVEDSLCGRCEGVVGGL
jgi:isoleucyl-tRNA synthetase